eukprot:1714371-Ditylum_brightwellii.AAC.1
MKHHVKTTAGVSAANYKHEPGSEKYGKGQGKPHLQQTATRKVGLLKLLWTTLAVHMSIKMTNQMKHHQEFKTDLSQLPKPGRI